MKGNLSGFIQRLKQDQAIQSQPQKADILSKINKYSTNDNSTAYFLGCFFEYHFDINKLSDSDKSFLIRIVKEKNLDQYFYLRKEPDSDGFGPFSYMLIALGPIAIFFGVIQLINGNFSYVLGTKYLVPIVREGGYKIILGIGFLIGGFLRVNYERKRKRFIESLTTITP